MIFKCFGRAHSENMSFAAVVTLRGSPPSGGSVVPFKADPIGPSASLTGEPKYNYG